MIEPRLRFKADDGSDFPDWEEKTLGELGTFTKGAALSKADISDEGNPLILYGELYTTYKEVAYEVKRKTQAIVDKIYYSNVGDVLIPTSGESAEEISTATCVMVPNVILAGDLNIFRSTVIDGRIMSYILNYQAKRKIATIAQGKSIVHIQAKQLGKIFVEYPVDKDEQQKIADFLSTIDTIIEKQRATVLAWEERKKGVMQKLFSQEVRFKADDGSDFPDWEECTVGELFVPVVKKNKDGSIQNVITNSAQYGLIPQRDFFDKDIAIKENTSNYTIIQNGDFVYNPRKSTTAPFGPFNIYERDEAGIVSPLYTCLTPKYKEMTPYLSWYFRTNKWHPYIVTHGAQSGARHDRVGMTATLMNGIPVIYPSLPEQQKIADCLSALDAVIEKQKETLEKWQELKKGLLQQMFV